MNHIRKFNESKSELDIQYFEECFIDFLDNTPENKNNYTKNGIDDGNLFRNSYSRDGLDYYHIQIFFPEFDNMNVIRVDGKFMSRMLEHYEIVGDIYKDIIVCTEKVKIKYPDSDFIFEFANTEEYPYKPPASIGVFIYKSKVK